MKLIYTMFVAFLLVLPACNRDRVRASSDENRTDQMKEQRAEYIRSVNAKLAEFDQKLDGLDARAKGMSGPEKRDFQESIDRLRDQRKDVGRKLDDLKKVSLDSWVPLKTEVDEAIASLERSYEQVSATHETVPSSAPKNAPTH